MLSRYSSPPARHKLQRCNIILISVHDAFNWLTVLILLPLELATHYLYHLTEAMTANIATPDNVDNPQFLTAITHPLTELIIMVCYRRYIIDAAKSSCTKN